MRFSGGKFATCYCWFRAMLTNMCHNLINFSDIATSNVANNITVSMHGAYRKNSKNWDTWNNYHNCPTIGTVGFYSAVLCSKDANRITNRADPDQTAPWGAVWSGSALFAQTYLSQYLKLLRYLTVISYKGVTLGTVICSNVHCNKQKQEHRKRGKIRP